jgi:hypothetical protein
VNLRPGLSAYEEQYVSKWHGPSPLNWKVMPGATYHAGLKARALRGVTGGRCFLAGVLMVCLLPAWSLHCAPVGKNEYAIKAAFLFHFAQLIDWPPETFQNATDPIAFCTIGKDPFDGEMGAVLSGKTIQHRSIRILNLRSLSDAKACQILFLGVDESGRLPNLLSILHKLPVFTVGENEGFIEDGGMIGFRSDDDRLRFEINVAAMEKCNLRISSSVLLLAKRVLPGKNRP